MTREEAIKRIKYHKIVHKMDEPNAIKISEALDMAIEALKAPTENTNTPTDTPTDLISRDKVLNLVLDVCNDVMDECESVTGICGEEVYTDVREVNAILKCNKRIRNGIKQLPSESVGNSEQLRSKGKWDRDREIPNTCSVCGEDWDKYVEGQEIWYTGEIPNFCPNCGADMRG